jgi:hypothetical protein
LHAGHAKLALTGHSLLPIPFFVLGIFIGTLLVLANPHRELPRHSFLVAALLTFDIAVIYFGWPGWLSITVLSTAMGLMNTSITHVGGQAVNLGFVTGDLNNFAQRLAMGTRQDPVPQSGFLGQSLVARSSVGRNMDCVPHWSRAWRSISVSLHDVGVVAACAYIVGFRSARARSDLRCPTRGGNGNLAVVPPFKTMA